MVSFDTFSLSEPVRRALAEMGFEEASPIQSAAIPVIRAGRDVIGQAQTGTGKTAAFGIPLVEAAIAGRLSLVLAPTRELAQQVAGEIERIGAHANVKALALYGGAPLGPQARAIERGDAQVIVATPGRLRDHIARGNLDPALASLVVLDEADEMLSMGFIEEIEEVLNAIPERQTLLFSATMPEPIVRLAERYLSDPELVAVAGENDSVATANTKQYFVEVRHPEKVDVLLRILAVERPDGTLVFRHTRETVDELVSALRAKNVPAEALHGGMPQNAREAVLDRFREGRVKVLVATNVAARGLDVDTLSHVVIFDAPRETETYVHRIGRTGRAGREGKAFLFVTPADRGKLRAIERTVEERLARYPVPTNADVAAAASNALSLWVAAKARETDGIEPYLAAVDAAIAEGADARALAAAALRAAARHEGLEAPKLEARREVSRADPAARPARAPNPTGPRAALTFNVGRDDGVRPGDLVGALTHGAGLAGSEIGRIDILPRMSVAEIPAERVEDVMDALEDATIRNREVRLRVAERWEFRGPAARGPPAEPAGASRRGGPRNSGMVTTRGA